MEPVGLGPRILAGIIDFIIMIVIMVPLTFIAGQSVGAQIGVSLVAIVYFIVMEALKGATVGKMAMKLRVVKAADGAAISWVESIIRNLLRIANSRSTHVQKPLLQSSRHCITPTIPGPKHIIWINFDSTCDATRCACPIARSQRANTCAIRAPSWSCRSWTTLRPRRSSSTTS